MMAADSNNPIITSLAADFAWCEERIKANSASFYAAFSLLPKAKREAVYAIYAFCRTADDSVDKYHSEKALHALHENLDRLCAGNTQDGPMWRALSSVFTSFGLKAEPFYDMLQGQRMDLSFAQPETLEELERYSYYVAGSVGLMLLPVLCTNPEKETEAQRPALALGVAMQLTNILRDVGEDLAVGRVYLPKAMMQKAGCTVQMLQQRNVGQAFCAVWESVAARAEELYCEMENNINLLDEDSRLPTLSSLYLYRGILDQVRRDGYDCLSRRSFLPSTARSALVHKAQKILAV